VDHAAVQLLGGVEEVHEEGGTDGATGWVSYRPKAMGD
jgi:hypothetical protein